MKKTIGSFAVCLLAAGICRGDFSPQDAGTSAAQFLKISPDAVSASMGGAGSALAASAASSLYANPASLAGLQDKDISVSHALWLEGISYNWAAFAVPTSAGVFGVSFRQMSYGNLDGTDEFGADTGAFSPSDMSAGITFARKISSIEAGISVKYVSSRIKETATALAADAGIRAGGLAGGKLSVGLAAKNIGSAMKYIAVEDPLPLMVSAGLGYEFSGNFAAALDVVAPRDNQSYLAAGCRYSAALSDDLNAAARFGYSGATPDVGGLAGLSAGFGAAWKNYSLDYAFAPYGDLGAAHRVSLGFSFR